MRMCRTIKFSSRAPRRWCALVGGHDPHRLFVEDGLALGEDLETGVLVWVIIAAGFAAGFRGVSGRGVAALTVVVPQGRMAPLPEAPPDEPAATFNGLGDRTRQAIANAAKTGAEISVVLLDRNTGEVVSAVMNACEKVRCRKVNSNSGSGMTLSEVTRVCGGRLGSGSLLSSFCVNR